MRGLPGGSTKFEVLFGPDKNGIYVLVMKVTKLAEVKDVSKKGPKVEE